jgi:putative RNA 2'-phosphotransferase
MNRRLTRISKYLSFVLKHQPASIGLNLDPIGWVDLDVLVSSANVHGKAITLAQVHEVLAQSEETRFELSDDGKRIRAAVEGK